MEQFGKETDGRRGDKKAQRWVDDTLVALTPAIFYVFFVSFEYFGLLCFVLSELRSRLAFESRIFDFASNYHPSPPPLGS